VTKLNLFRLSIMTACLRFTRRVSLEYYVVSDLNSDTRPGLEVLYRQRRYVLIVESCSPVYVQPDQVTMRGASPTYVDISWVKSEHFRPQDS
jgi:hypothetical protein